MAQLTNSFEGGTDGVTITSGNSGGSSGDAFSNMSGSPAFSATHRHVGTLAMACVDAASEMDARWNFGPDTGNVYFRTHIYLTAYPTTQNLWFIDCDGGAALGFNTTLVVRSSDHCIGGAVQASLNAGLTGTTVVPLNQFVRVELRVLASTTVGEIEWRLYTSVDSTTIADTKSMTGQVLQADARRIRFGVVASPPTTPFTHWQDDIAYSNVDWLGPISAPSTPKTGSGIIGP